MDFLCVRESSNRMSARLKVQLTPQSCCSQDKRSDLFYDVRLQREYQRDPRSYHEFKDYFRRFSSDPLPLLYSFVLYEYSASLPSEIYIDRHKIALSLKASYLNLHRVNFYRSGEFVGLIQLHTQALVFYSVHTLMWKLWCNKTSRRMANVFTLQRPNLFTPSWTAK